MAQTPSTLDLPDFEAIGNDPTALKMALVMMCKELQRVHKLMRDDMIAVETYEIIMPGNVLGDNGNYRHFVSGNNLIIQRRESGTWTPKYTIEAA